MGKFKVGDKVIGNKKASVNYDITVEGWKGTVTAVNSYQIRVYGPGSINKEGFWVNPDCFDLVLPAPNNHLDELISIFTRKNRVVATITKGEQKFTQSISLHKANGDFKAAVKMVVEKLLDRFEAGEQAPLTATSIDWEAFKAGKFAVHCDTEEKAEEFLKECDKQGIKWCTGEKASLSVCFHSYKEKTAYCCYFVPSKLEYCDTDWYREQGKAIIEYTPSKPTVKELEPKPYRIVKQDKYEVGDKVKIVDEWVPESFENDEGKMDKWLGKIMTIRVVNSDYYRMEEDKTENCGTGWYWNNKCIEGKVVEDIQVNPAVKEVKRPAKVGEWIKVVDGSGHDNGTGIFKVTSLNWNNYLPDWVYVNGKSSGIIRGDQYVVLENYQPESSSLDSNPEQEQPTSSTGMREVERFAKEGDIIEVLTGDGHRAEVGGIYKVLRPWDDYGWIEVQLSPEQDTDVLRYDQYVVLENYDYSLGHPKNEPFRKAKVGDKIKVVKGKYIGEVLTVSNVGSNFVDVKYHDYFYDTNQEYIIIEEAPEAIEIGDTVKVVNNGKCYTRYEEWFVKNAPQYLGKFAYGGMPKNGGSYKVLMKNDKDGLKYVIQEIDWPNDAVYLIDEKGIEKVR